MPMNTDKKDKVVLDHQTQRKNKDLPRKLDREARLSVVNTRMFLIAILMGIGLLYSIYAQDKASTRSDNNIKVAFVKMYPNGTWDIDFHDETRGVEFFKPTIDHFISNWVVRRYSEIPESIDADYGYIYAFMSPELQNRFLHPEGFNALEKAAEVVACTQCLRVKVPAESITIDHFDEDRTLFSGKHEGTLHRSNVFATIEKIGANGIPNGEPQEVIISLQWRIKSVEEIQANEELLKQNPIGLEILDYRLLLNKNKQKQGGKP